LKVAEDDENLRRLVRDSSLPVMLVQLDAARILEVSDAVAAMCRSSRDELLGRDATGLAVDRELARARLNLLAAGELDSYRVRGRAFQRADGTYFVVDACLRAVTDEMPRRLAVGVVLPIEEPLVPASSGAGRPDPIVLGSVGENWRIERISSDVEHLLAMPAADVVGAQLSTIVEPADWPSLLIAIGHGLQADGASTIRLHFRGLDGASRLCVMLITAVAGAGAGFAFALFPADQPSVLLANRAWELKSHIRRIAREVAASGILERLIDTPTAASLPAMSGLSSRELEIVSGLLAGERVQMLASRMFLSQSTIRNHLTSVYRKLGVSNQQELITMLRADLSAQDGSRGFA
jgi:PAS domain S-box-containing protein